MEIQEVKIKVLFPYTADASLLLCIGSEYVYYKIIDGVELSNFQYLGILRNSLFRIDGKLYHVETNAPGNDLIPTLYSDDETIVDVTNAIRVPIDSRGFEIYLERGKYYVNFTIKQIKGDKESKLVSDDQKTGKKRKRENHEEGDDKIVQKTRLD